MGRLTLTSIYSIMKILAFYDLLCVASIVRS
jgi:hypothetical protein